MKANSTIARTPGLHFLKGIADLGPVAHGTLSFVRKAIENGRKLEEMILDEGIALLERLREQE